MPTYLYGLILARNAPRAPGDGRGIADAAVRVLRCGGSLAGLVSDLAAAPGRASFDSIRAHDAALQQTVDAGVTVAAMRFGHSFTSDADACGHVSEYGGRVSALLERFDGCVEMRLLVPATGLRGSRFETPDAQAATREGPGQAYLRQLRDERDVAHRWSLRAALGDVVRAERVSPIRDQGAAFAHLVVRRDIAAYREAVRRVRELADATIVGPLALYSFSEPTA